MKLMGLNEEALNKLGAWYTYHEGNNKSIINKLQKPQQLGYKHFTKMVQECHEFNKQVTLVPFEDGHPFKMSFTSKDANDRDVIIRFMHGDQIDFPPVLMVLDGEKTDILLYYFNHSKKQVRDMNEEEREVYNRLFNEKQNNQTK